MTNEQIDLVKTSFDKIAPVSETFATLFYARLFEIDPNLRRLFTNDIRQQGQKLMQMIGLAVKSLERIDELLPVVQSLGKKHAGYGVEDHHYETVATALIWTLEVVLGADFTPETREAWTTVYELLAQTMRSASAPKTEKLPFAPVAENISTISVS